MSGNDLKPQLIRFNPYDNPAHASILKELQHTDGIAIYRPQNITYSFENKSDPFQVFHSNIVYLHNDSAIVDAATRGGVTPPDDRVGTAPPDDLDGVENRDNNVATGVRPMLTGDELLKMLMIRSNLVYLCEGPSCTFKLQFTGPCYNGNDECFNVNSWDAADENRTDDNLGVKLWEWEPQQVQLAFLKGNDLYKDFESNLEIYEPASAILIPFTKTRDAIRHYNIDYHALWSGDALYAGDQYHWWGNNWYYGPDKVSRLAPGPDRRTLRDEGEGVEETEQGAGGRGAAAGDGDSGYYYYQFGAW